MNPEIKAQWVAALRSGEYQQGKNDLNRDGKFCCLGVLCEIAVAHGVVYSEAMTRLQRQMRYHSSAERADCSATVPPHAVIEWAGLRFQVPVVGGWHLTTLNDTEGFTFDEIADLIEEHL